MSAESEVTGSGGGWEEISHYYVMLRNRNGAEREIETGSGHF